MDDLDTADIEKVKIDKNGAYNIVANNVHPKMGDLDTINMQNTGPRGGCMVSNFWDSKCKFGRQNFVDYYLHHAAGFGHRQLAV